MQTQVEVSSELWNFIVYGRDSEPVSCARPYRFQRHTFTSAEAARLKQAYDALPHEGDRWSRKPGVDRLFAESGLTVQAFARAVGWQLRPGAVK